MKTTLLTPTFTLSLALFSASSFARGGMSTGGVLYSASALCGDKGGEIESYSDKTRNLEMCRLGNARIEAWTLFGAVMSNARSEAVEAYRNHKNPTFQCFRAPCVPRAEMYCETAGGHAVELMATNDLTLPACAFRDGSIIGLETLAAGPHHAVNHTLTAVLSKRH